MATVGPCCWPLFRPGCSRDPERVTTTATVRRTYFTRDMRLAYAGSGLAALLMATASIAGLLFGSSLYGVHALLSAFVGQDMLNLVIAVPLLLGSMWLASRGSLVGSLAWPGALFYLVYDYGFYVLGAPFGPLFLVYLVLVTISVYAAAGVVLSIDSAAVRSRFVDRVPERVVGAALVALAVIFIALWTAMTLNGLTGPGLDLIARTVVTLDLTVQLPALLAGGVLLWRRRPLGYVVAPGLLLQMAAYLLGLSAICILGRDATGAPVTPAAYLPGLVVGPIGLFLIGLFVRAAVRRPSIVTHTMAVAARP